MTQNIEQRTEAAVKKYEGASAVVEALANTDSTVGTGAGDRKSFPKLSREIEADARKSIRLGFSDNQGHYSAPVNYEKSNWTYVYNGQQWGLRGTFDLSLLPYTATQADPNNDPNLVVYGRLQTGYVNQAETVPDMINGLSVGGDTINNEVGYTWSVNGNTWKCISVSNPMTIDDFEVVNSDFKLHKDDWGVIEKHANHTPPYSAVEYTIAVENGLNIKTAIDVAGRSNCKEVVFASPYEIDVHYRYDGGTISDFGCIELEGLRNLDIEGVDTELRVIFDSENTSPYDTSGGSAYNHRGQIFLRTDCTNVNIMGFKLRGECYLRAWVTGEEWVEQCYGIRNRYGVINCTDKRIDSHGFAGDGVTGAGNWPDEVDPQLHTRFNSLVFTAGDIDETGSVVALAGAYHSEIVDISNLKMHEYDYIVSMVGTGNGDRLTVRNRVIKAVLYDVNTNVIDIQYFRQSWPIHCTPETAQIRVVFYDDERTDATVDYADSDGYYWAIATGYSRNYKLLESKIHDNHRGGISNVPQNTLIYDNDIYDNGQGEKFGWPLFPDTTRFAFDMENGYSDLVTLEKNRISGHFNNILAPSVGTLNVYDNEVVGGLSLAAIYHSYEINTRGNSIKKVVRDLINNAVSYSGGKHIEQIVKNTDNTIIGYGAVVGPTTESSVGVAKTRIIESDNVIEGYAYDVKDATCTSRGSSIDILDNPYQELFLMSSDKMSSCELVINSKDPNYRHIDISNAVKDANDLRFNVAGPIRLAARNYSRYREVQYCGGVTLNYSTPQYLKVGCLKTDASHGEWPKATSYYHDLKANASTVELVKPPAQSSGTLLDNDVIFRDVHLECSYQYGFITLPDVSGNDNAIINVTFIGGTIENLEQSARLISINWNESDTNTLNIRFINTTFIADTPTSLAFVFINGDGTSRLSVTLEECKLINVTNTDAITVIS